ncbi:ankyrin repeat domain containing protein [Musa troglodytarum]|uniref:Ankyrin repeat domain containing protein n=1 Tax=Musa troglodytarum TaxID=320322 RepID=A0A9E7EPV7_9LILI|nr:ankyrin repeat domain containing protein [Musa troglodytarum]
MEDLSKYAHSPAHLAVARRDHACLRRMVVALPRLPKAGEVTTEEESLAGELTADAVSAIIDRRDVPHRETPLHLAVRMRDAISAEILMSAGADWSLQNVHGWSALQEAVCTREDAIAMIIARHYQPLAWAKWCRRLPRIVSSIERILDFYMEITFHFESSVIPFISRIAPSDTYRIWKRGPNLRADMTLAGFDGFRIQRSDQTFLFLGQGAPAEDVHPPLPPGSLIVLAHKEKEITNALEGAGAKPTEAEVAHEVALMSQTNMYRPGIDVTQAELVPHLNWRRQERAEMVGNWKTKVYDMLNVMVSVKSRRVPGAMTDEELFTVDNDERIANGGDLDGELDDVLTPEERMQLDSALRMDNSQGLDEYGGNGGASEGVENSESNGVTKERTSWFGWSSKRTSKNTGGEDADDAKNKHVKLCPENGHHKSESAKEMGDIKKGKEKGSKKKTGNESNKHESEFKKGVRPVLWLTPDFPLKTDELLPLLDVLANKVKAVRRLRELLTTKLPQGTFPVKVNTQILLSLKAFLFGALAIPIVPTIRVLITFTKFEELQQSDEFSTPLSSPTHFQESKAKETEGSGSWYSWVKRSRGGQSSDSSEGRSCKDEIDPFHIPSDYTWIDATEKKRRMKAKKGKSKRGTNRKQSTRGSEDQQLLDGFE